MVTLCKLVSMILHFMLFFSRLFNAKFLEMQISSADPRSWNGLINESAKFGNRNENLSKLYHKKLEDFFFCLRLCLERVT